jgi:hypothetical protein
MRGAANWLTWLVILFGLWLGFVGATSAGEELAGIVTAGLGATAAEVVRRHGLFSYRPPLALLRSLPLRAWYVVRDFVLLLAVLGRSLATRRVRDGAFRVLERETGGDDARGRGLRAYVGWAGSLAPNTLVVHVDEAEHLVLEHELVRDRSSPDPLP